MAHVKGELARKRLFSFELERAIFSLPLGMVDYKPFCEDLGAVIHNCQVYRKMNDVEVCFYARMSTKRFNTIKKYPHVARLSELIKLSKTLGFTMDFRSLMYGTKKYKNKKK